jgi:hypothetical protein
MRDLDDSVLIEAACLRCLYTCVQSPIQLLLTVDHRDVHMDEVAKHLACPKMGCRHVGVRLFLISMRTQAALWAGFLKHLICRENVFCRKKYLNAKLRSRDKR